MIIFEYYHNLDLLSKQTRLLNIIIPSRHKPTAMPNANVSLDVRLQIVFGIFAILSLIAGLASLHTRDSLGAVWFRSIHGRLQRTFSHSNSVFSNQPSDSTSEVDEEYYAGFTRLDSISIPSSRISFEEDAL